VHFKFPWLDKTYSTCSSAYYLMGKVVDGRTSESDKFLWWLKKLTLPPPSSHNCQFFFLRGGLGIIRFLFWHTVIVTSHIYRFDAEAECFMVCSNGDNNEWVHCVSSPPSISLLSHVYITCVGRLPPIIIAITIIQTTLLVYYHKIVLMAIACIIMAKLQRAAVQTWQWEHSCYRYSVLQCWQPFPCPKCLLHKAQ
jgi:hypothetical protein